MGALGFDDQKKKFEHTKVGKYLIKHKRQITTGGQGLWATMVYMRDYPNLDRSSPYRNFQKLEALHKMFAIAETKVRQAINSYRFAVGFEKMNGQKLIGNATFLDDLKQKIQKRQTCVGNTQERDAMLGEAIDLQDLVHVGRRGGGKQLYASATFSASSNRAGNDEVEDLGGSQDLQRRVRASGGTGRRGGSRMSDSKFTLGMASNRAGNDEEAN